MPYPYWNNYSAPYPNYNPNLSTPLTPSTSVPPYTPPAASVQQANSFFYVNGKEGAKAFNIAPNAKVLLMDSDNPIFYLKEANDLGQATIREFKFEEITGKTSSASADVMQKELDELKNKVAKLEEAIAGEIK